MFLTDSERNSLIAQLDAAQKRLDEQGKTPYWIDLIASEEISKLDKNDVLWLVICDVDRLIKESLGPSVELIILKDKLLKFWNAEIKKPKQKA